MIKAEGITKSFGELQVLKNINVEIEPSKITSIVGASGAGKTTLLQILGTLDKPSTGKIMIGDVEVTSLKSKALSDFRNKEIGFVFQFHHLLPEFTAIENVMIPGLIGSFNRNAHEKRAKELLDFLKLSHRIHHKPSELSGGEQQRVAIARALLNKPSLILADEPSGNLDSANADDLHQLFLELRDEMNATFVIVTHNKELAGLSDAVITMKDGEIISGQ
jgi:lipoprotein-releasing system ATP-binding protein